MTAPKVHSPVYTAEEMEWNDTVRWFTQFVPAQFVPAIIDEAIRNLPPVAVAYGWDGKKWGVVPWTVPGDVPTLIGYYGGPLDVRSSDDPAPVGEPKAGLQMRGIGNIVMSGCYSTTCGASCLLIDCYIEP